MRSRRRKTPRMFRHTVIIFLAAVLCLTIIGVTGAKYVSESSGTDSAWAAQLSPSFDSENIDISDIKVPGDRAEKTFAVRNYTGDSVTEVTLKYKITVKTTGNLPLQFSVLDSEGDTVKAWPCSGTGAEQVYEYEDDAFVFSPGEKLTHTYTLKAEWPAEQNGAQFAEQTDAVYISVTWEQVD